MADIQAQLPVRISDGTNDVTITSAGALKVDASGTTQSVVVSNFPTVQSVSGTVSVSGTANIATVERSSGVIVNSNTATNVAVNATGTNSYTVSAGKTFYLKQVTASSSGPCKVEVEYGPVNSPNNITTGFTSASSPMFDVSYAQSIPISAGTAVRIKTTNTNNKAQDLYSTIYGCEV